MVPEYRRADIRSGTYFFTVNSFRRQRILTAPRVRVRLREAIAAGYCFLDTIALCGAPMLARFISHCGTAFRRLQPVPMRVIQAPSARDSG